MSSVQSSSTASSRTLSSAYVGYGRNADTGASRHHDASSRDQVAELIRKSCNPVLKEGYLCKEGRRVKNWKRRFFLLEGGFLLYYKGMDSYRKQELQGLMSVRDCEVLLLEQGRGEKESEDERDLNGSRTSFRRSTVRLSTFLQNKERTSTMLSADSDSEDEDKDGVVPGKSEWKFALRGPTRTLYLEAKSEEEKVEWILALQNSINVEHYVSTSEKLNCKPLDIIVQALSNDRITEMDLSNMRLTRYEIEAIASGLETNEFLRSLKWEDSDLSQMHMVALGEMLRSNGTLHFLSLMNNRINGSGIASLMASIYANVSLASMNLCGNVLGNDGAGHVSDLLSANVTLTLLDLSDNGIGPQGAVYIANALRVNNTLKTLRLSRNPLQDDGMESVCSGLTIGSALTGLDVSHCQFGSVGCRHIEQLLRSTNTLKELDVRGNAVDEESAQALFAVLKDVNRSIRCVNVGLMKGVTDTSEAIRTPAQVLKARFMVSKLSLVRKRTPSPPPKIGVSRSSAPKRELPARPAVPPKPADDWGARSTVAVITENPLAASRRSADWMKPVGPQARASAPVGTNIGANAWKSGNPADKAPGVVTQAPAGSSNAPAVTSTSASAPHSEVGNTVPPVPNSIAVPTHKSSGGVVDSGSSSHPERAAHPSVDAGPKTTPLHKPGDSDAPSNRGRAGSASHAMSASSSGGSTAVGQVGSVSGGAAGTSKPHQVAGQGSVLTMKPSVHNPGHTEPAKHATGAVRASSSHDAGVSKVPAPQPAKHALAPQPAKPVPAPQAANPVSVPQPSKPAPVMQPSKPASVPQSSQPALSAARPHVGSGVGSNARSQPSSSANPSAIHNATVDGGSASASTTKVSAPAPKHTADKKAPLTASSEAAQSRPLTSTGNAKPGNWILKPSSVAASASTAKSAEVNNASGTGAGSNSGNSSSFSRRTEDASAGRAKSNVRKMIEQFARMSTESEPVRPHRAPPPLPASRK